MIVDDLDVARPSRPGRPGKANPPLAIDADTELPLSVAFRCFEMIAWQSEVPQRYRRVELLEPILRLPSEPGECAYPLALGEGLRSLVAVAQDHGKD